METTSQTVQKICINGFKLVHWEADELKLHPIPPDKDKQQN